LIFDSDAATKHQVSDPGDYTRGARRRSRRGRGHDGLADAVPRGFGGRHAEDVSKAPISTSAFSGATLEQKGVNNVADLVKIRFAASGRGGLDATGGVVMPGLE